MPTGPRCAAFAAAVEAEAAHRLDAFLHGVACYHAHPYRRSLPEPPVLWREGTTRLLDYGLGEGGLPVLLVPSLVNRAYILDLAEGNSFARWLARARGLRPLVVDWGAPGAVERGYSLTDYIAGRLDHALDAALESVGEPGGGRLAVLGYCMGGLLALALATRRPEVARLALLATPWDFHAGPEGVRALAGLAAGLGALWKPAVTALGEMPVDAIQAMFAALDPFLVPRKFARFAGLDPGSAQARCFVALEDWINDGVALAAPVAGECLQGWYGANTPARGAWKVGGRAVDPAGFAGPSLVVVPQRDRIVPPGSADALAALLPNARRLRVPLGHIGMVAGRRAQSVLWEPLADWLADK